MAPARRSSRKNQGDDSSSNLVELEDIDESLFREELFSAVEWRGSDRSTQRLVDLMFRAQPSLQPGLSPRTQREVILKFVSHRFSKGNARRFFAGVLSILETVIENETYVPESIDGDDNNGNNGPEEATENSQCEDDTCSSESLQYIKACALIVESHVERLVLQQPAKNRSIGTKSIPVIDEVFRVMELLHDSLLTLQHCSGQGIVVQSKIMALCEFWWHQHLMDRECMVVQLLPLLLARSLDDSPNKSDVKRLYQLHEALDAVDFEDDRSLDLRSLMLRTLSSPLFLKVAEGRRWIARMLSIPALITDAHYAVRVQIPESKKTILRAYGDIYFRTWKEAEVELRELIEEIALHDLAFALVHLANPPMVRSIHLVMEPFHTAKKAAEIEQLLHRLYGPILWRSLSAANPSVRVNASMVLSKLFPLGDGLSKPDQAVKRGCESLKSLLVDVDPRVRAAAAEATTEILSLYWNVLPSSEIRALLNHIVTKHASDVSSSAVRASALAAITVLLDTEESHAVLRPLLPLLGNLIHDKVERVRLATVRLLDKIKSLHGIKYYHVVPVHHLLARLVEEGRPPRNPRNPVASALTALIMNSYFPQGQDVSGSEQVQRSLVLLSTDSIAAEVFFANLPTYLSVNSCSKLVAMMLKCMVAAVESESRKATATRKRKHPGSNFEDTDTGGLTAANTGLMASLAETICSLWESIGSKLRRPEFQACYEFLLDAFSGALLTNVNAYFERKVGEDDDKESKTAEDCHRVCSAILRCAGRLSPEHVDGLASQITKKLESVEMNEKQDVTPHVAVLCLWGMTEDVAKSLSASILRAFGDDGMASPSFDAVVRNSRKRRNDSLLVRAALPSLPPLVAMNVLEDILNSRDPSSLAARNAIMSSMTACTVIEECLERATTRAERILLCDPTFCQHITVEEVELVLRGCEAFGRFALHHAAENVDFNHQAKTLLHWTTDNVLPVLHGLHSGIRTSLDVLEISRISSSSGGSPGSPSTPPSRHRANRSNSPTGWDGSFSADMRLSLDSRCSPTLEIPQHVASSLMNSSCIIFSEWLAVGGKGVGEIVTASCDWSSLFACEGDGRLQAELLPAFMRLSLQLCIVSDDFTLLRLLLEKCVNSGNKEETVIVRQCITTLLGKRERLTAAVDAVLKAAHNVIGGGGTEELEAPLDLVDVWDWPPGYIPAALSAILSNRDATTILARLLVPDAMDPEKALFRARCLWFMAGIEGTRDAVREVATNLTLWKDYDKNVTAVVNLVLAAIK